MCVCVPHLRAYTCHLGSSHLCISCFTSTSLHTHEYKHTPPTIMHLKDAELRDGNPSVCWLNDGALTAKAAQRAGKQSGKRPGSEAANVPLRTRTCTICPPTCPNKPAGQLQPTPTLNRVVTSPIRLFRDGFVCFSTFLTGLHPMRTRICQERVAEQDRP